MQGFTSDLNARHIASRIAAGGVLALVALSAVAQGAAPAVVPDTAATVAQPTSPDEKKREFEAQEARGPLNQRYPAGSITSEEVAAKALDDAPKAKDVVNTRYILDQRACYKKFLVSSCLEDARDRKRQADKEIKQVENEANIFQRQARVDDRDRSLAEQHAKDAEDAVRRQQEQKQKEADSARKVQESRAKQQEVQQRVEQNKNVPADYRQREHDAKVRQQQAEEAAKAPERAANAAARQQRIKDAEQHRLEVERKKAENERERAERKEHQQQDAQPKTPAAQ